MAISLETHPFVNTTVYASFAQEHRVVFTVPSSRFTRGNISKLGVVSVMTYAIPFSGASVQTWPYPYASIDHKRISLFIT